MKKLFYRVDLQNDFIQNDGALSVPGAKNILPITEKISRLIENEISANPENVAVAYSMDWHDGSEPEMTQNGGPFPLHCIAYSQGAELAKEAIISVDSIIFKKKTFDVGDEKLGDPNFLSWISTCKFDEVWIDGLVGNICVEAAVNHFVKYIKNVYIFENAVKWMDMEQGIFSNGSKDNETLSKKRMRNLGAYFSVAKL